MELDIFAKLTFLTIVILMFLPVILVVMLGKSREKHLTALKQNGTTEQIARLKLHSDTWPDRVVQIQNAFKNQFELPVLFYALSGLALALDMASVVLLSLCAAFVLVRYAHAYVHVTSNYIPHRLNLYTASLAIVVVQMLYLSVRVLGA